MNVIESDGAGFYVRRQAAGDELPSLGLGRLYRRTGNLEQAQQHLITAMGMYAEMGMTYWREKLENSS